MNSPPSPSSFSPLPLFMTPLKSNNSFSHIVYGKRTKDFSSPFCPFSFLKVYGNGGSPRTDRRRNGRARKKKKEGKSARERRRGRRKRKPNFRSSSVGRSVGALFRSEEGEKEEEKQNRIVKKVGVTTTKKRERERKRE